MAELISWWQCVDTLSVARRCRPPPGIGYPNTNGYNADRRHLDFTRGPAEASVFPDKTTDGYGGQAAYIRFLGNQLLPHVQSRLNADPGRRVLLGHSLAGYFVLDLLSQRPDMFNGYVSFSPSVWWDRAGVGVSERHHAADPPLYGGRALGAGTCTLAGDQKLRQPVS